MESFRDATLAEASRHDLRLTGMFTPQQLEIMKRLGIRTYLSSDACIFRRGGDEGRGCARASVEVG